MFLKLIMYLQKNAKNTVSDKLILASKKKIIFLINKQYEKENSISLFIELPIQK